MIYFNGLYVKDVAASLNADGNCGYALVDEELT